VTEYRLPVKADAAARRSDAITVEGDMVTVLGVRGERVTTRGRNGRVKTWQSGEVVVPDTVVIQPLPDRSFRLPETTRTVLAALIAAGTGTVCTTEEIAAVTGLGHTATKRAISRLSRIGVIKWGKGYRSFRLAVAPVQFGGGVAGE